MLIDLVLAGKRGLVVGRGVEAEYKTLKLLDAKAEVTILSDDLTPRLRKLVSSNRGRVELVEAKPTPAAVRKLVERDSPKLVYIWTGDGGLDERLSAAARRTKAPPLVCVVDDPRLNDFNMPAIAKVGGIRVGVSTEGRSPAMAGILRQKIERLITPQDVMQVRLQGHIRKAARERLKDAASRKDFVYKVIEDQEIGALLAKGDFSAAKKRAETMLDRAGSASGDKRETRHHAQS